jgi:hypothetical protein
VQPSQDLPLSRLLDSQDDLERRDHTICSLSSQQLCRPAELSLLFQFRSLVLDPVPDHLGELRGGRVFPLGLVQKRSRTLLCLQHSEFLHRLHCADVSVHPVVVLVLSLPAGHERSNDKGRYEISRARSKGARCSSTYTLPKSHDDLVRPIATIVGDRFRSDASELLPPSVDWGELYDPGHYRKQDAIYTELRPTLLSNSLIVPREKIYEHVRNLAASDLFGLQQQVKAFQRVTKKSPGLTTSSPSVDFVETIHRLDTHRIEVESDCFCVRHAKLFAQL